MKLTPKYLLAFLLTLALSAPGTAQFIFDKEDQDQPIGQNIEHFVTTRDLTIQEILQVDSFTRFNTSVPNFGMVNGNVWLRVKIDNQSGEREQILRLAYPILDEVTFFKRTFIGWDSITYRQDHSPDSRDLQESAYSFLLTIPPGETREYYLKVRNMEQVITPIMVHDRDGWLDSIRRDVIISAFYAGIIFIMMAYNLFVFFSVRDRSYISYVLYLLFIGLTQLGIKGAVPFYMIDFIPGIHHYGLTLAGSMGAMFGVIFTRDFLHTTENTPRVDKVLKVLPPVFIVASILPIIGLETIGFLIMQLGTSVSALAIFVAAISASIKGLRSAKFFTLAWSSLLVGVIIFLLKDAGVLPYNNYTNYIMLVASGIEISLLSFALADKINILQKEANLAREREVDALKENEKLIREQNVLLENRVEQRTQDLKVANENLEGTLSTLKNAQSQLVSQEKMASLGQLTAGIAHEINNPINFVSSNVAPLRRDIEDLKEVIYKYDELTEEERYQEIKQIVEKFKKEIEYQYLVDEINQLLDGIQDGADRTAEIVKSLKNFSRLDEIESKFANIHEGIRSTLVILKSGSKKKVPIETNFDESIEPIECYPGKLNQVFSNLIVNAIQALTDPEKGVEDPKIIISSKDLGEKVEVQVSDNGPGIPEKVLDKIFEPFFTTKDVGEGTGLGLSIVFSIIESHNGSIDVTSKVGEGTTFVITLPKSLH